MTRWSEQQYREDAAKRARWQRGGVIVNTTPAVPPGRVADGLKDRDRSSASFPPGAPAHKSVRAADTAAQPGTIYPLVNLCRLAGLPEPTPEHRFHPIRKWRADYAFLFTTPRVLVEIDGGAWTQGRHTRGAGFIEDQRKLNAAALLGFVVLRYTPDRLAECIADLRILFAKEAV